MRIFYRIVFVLVFFFNENTFSQQAPAIEWQNTIGGSSADALYSIQQTIDGGYI